MKFGKLQDIRHINFTLPATPAYTQQCLANLSESKTPTLYVGCTGWSMKAWVGHIYPSHAKPKDYLKYYSQQFNTIELNTTHYRIPTIETIQKWKRDAVDDFKFCPKLPKIISHSSDLGLNNGQLRLFCEAIKGLDEKLGCCFMQMPPYIGSDQFNKLAFFLEKFPNDIPLSLEVRHPSWFNTSESIELLADLLAQHNCAFVITDVAGRRDVLHQYLTNDKAIIRFVGNDLHPSDYTRIDAWLLRLQEWFAAGLREVFFFTHEPDNIQAPELAEYLVEKSKQLLKGVETRGPQFIKKEGGQMSLF